MADIKLDLILGYVPKNEHIDWNGLYSTSLGPIFDAMKGTPQYPLYHAEGDAFEHTRLVCEALVRQEEYRSASDFDKAILFLASLLHDIGKTKCTRLDENGNYISPRHSIVGASMTRELLWRELGLCGTSKKQEMRECICSLIRYHSYPPFAFSDKNATEKLVKIASIAQTVPSFSINKLCLLERADVLGRIGSGRDDYLERVALCVEMARELGCLDAPYNFKDKYSQRAYFQGKTSYLNDELYDSSFGDVIMLCGLPGTGKDTFISKNFSHLPVVSLDDIRIELGILPTKNQGRVLARATELSREYLRKKQPFVWNSTSIDALQRASKISLFEEYGARVKIIFLEAEWNENLKRNKGRGAVVPNEVIVRMLSRLEPPMPYEAFDVSWIIN